ncbi:MAG TPA: protein kinase, partial [Acidobacteriota bacterium]|nr:protein kinase [Acidobacteriota bacterium]
MNPVTILVVDDNEEFRTFLVTILQDEGFAVTPASSVKEAMALVEREKPRMIIVDLMMPETPGDELCRIIKDDPYLRDVIIIILSATADIEVKLTCFASGANEYLVKPVDSRELVARVKRFIRMMDEFRDTPHSGAQTKIEKFSMEKSYGSIELMDSSTGDSVARIKPKYGIYRVDNLIGSGGMGHVFKAYDEPLDRYVAIKILSKKLSRSPEFVERFKREAKVLAAINHPGIAYIFSFGQEDEDLYFSMQWCPGGSVSDLIRAKGRVDLLPAIEIMLQSAQALAAATRKGIVHRDVKPSNLLFDENQQIKIVDFGLASAEKMSTQITQVQEFLGTPSFMAPEQAQSASVDYRADIYSLGITFYYLLYGKLPFQANSAIEMVVKHASEPFPAFDSSNGRIPKEAYDIILRMTQKLPDQRYRDYSELISDLEKVRSMLLSQSQLKIPKAEKISGPPAVTSRNFFELLAGVNQQNLPGVLTAKWGGLQKTFLVRQRHVVLFESSQTDEDIWAFLVHKNIITAQDMPAKNAGLEATLAKYLLDQKFSMEQFKIAYRELMKSALLQIFLWPVFEGEFAHAGIEHDAFVKVPIADALLEASRTLIDLSALKEDLAPSDIISKTSEFEQVLSTLALKPEESFLASRIEGQDITLSTLQMLTG